MKKDINSREDAVTKDMQPDRKQVERTFRFPSLGVEVKAASLQDALKKAKAEAKKK